MGEECVEGPNECWNVYTLPEKDRKTSSFGVRVTRGAGCKNIGSIGMGEQTMFSAFACQNMCETDADCLGFLLLAKGCNDGSQTSSGDDDDDGYTCQLLSGECEEDASPTYACWDVHYKESKQGKDMKDMYHFTEDAQPGDTVIHVTDEECFRVGDTIELFHEAEDANHRYTVESLNEDDRTITISPAMTHEYSEGTGVLRINYGCSPTYCGDWPDDCMTALTV